MNSADLIAIVITLTILIAVGVYQAALALSPFLQRSEFCENRIWRRTRRHGWWRVGDSDRPRHHGCKHERRANRNPPAGRTIPHHEKQDKNDLVTEFSVRVIESSEGVRTAARTLGARTQDPTALKEVIQES